MNIPKDPKGTAPEDVEGHAFRWGSDEAQATEQHDTGEDVEGHGSQRPRPDADDGGEDVEGHRFRM